MAKPYSYDLRKKVIEAIEQDGLKKSEASQLFNISRNPIDLWLKRFQETGDFQAKPNQPLGNNHKILDWENSSRLLAPRGTRPKKKWLNFGPGEISARTRSRA